MTECVIEEIAEHQQQYYASCTRDASAFLAKGRVDCHRSEDEDTGDNGHRDVEIAAAFLRHHRIDHCCQTEDNERVDNVRAKDIGDGKVGRALHYGNHIHHKLRHACAEGNHRQTYHKVTDAEPFGECRSAVNQPVRTFHQCHKTCYNEYRSYPPAER